MFISSNRVNTLKKVEEQSKAAAALAAAAAAANNSDLEAGGGGDGLPEITVDPPSRRQSKAKQGSSSSLPWGYKFFGDWLPRLRFCGAWSMLMMNVFLPGIGTLAFCLTWLTGDDFAVSTTIRQRWSVASIGVLYGFAQFILTPFLFGWAWAILTGIMAVRQAKWIDWMDKKEARMQTLKNPIIEEDEEQAAEGNSQAGDGDSKKQKRTKDIASLRQPKKPPTPPPLPPDSPPPGWVYRLYPGPLNNNNDGLAPPDGRDSRGSRASSRQSRSRSRTSTTNQRSRGPTPTRLKASSNPQMVVVKPASSSDGPRASTGRRSAPSSRPSSSRGSRAATPTAISIRASNNTSLDNEPEQAADAS